MKLIGDSTELAMMDYDDDSKDDNPFRNYSIPVYIYAASIGVVIIGQIVQASMGSWYRKVEAEKLALERQRIAEIQAEAHRSLYLPTDRVRIGRGFKNIDPVYPFAWIAIVLAVVATYRLNQELSEHKCIQSKDELGVAINCPGGEWWDKFALKFTCITTFTLGVHAVLMPVVMVLKYFDFRPSDYSSCLRSSARKQVDESGLAWSVLSVHMNCCMKVSTIYCLMSRAPSCRETFRSLLFFVQIYFFLLGGVLGLVNKILQLIAMYLCVDLRILYFPSPFVEFSESRARIESMRIGKRTVKFDADFGEVYLRHCMDKLLSFLTLTLSDKWYVGILLSMNSLLKFTLSYPCPVELKKGITNGWILRCAL